MATTMKENLTISIDSELKRGLDDWMTERKLCNEATGKPYRSWVMENIVRAFLRLDDAGRWQAWNQGFRGDEQEPLESGIHPVSDRPAQQASNDAVQAVQIPRGLWEAFGHYLEAEGILDSPEMRTRVVEKLMRTFLFDMSAESKESAVWPERNYENRRGEEDLFRAACDGPPPRVPEPTGEDDDD